MRGRVKYDTPARMTRAARNDLRWWLDEMECNNGWSLQTRQWDEVIESDASLREWGASSKGVTTGSPWTREEAKSHINYLELLAGLLALKSFVAKRTEIVVLLRMDNVTAFINRMGSTHSEDLSNLAVELRKWCLHRRILVHAEHLPGRENTRADWGSRQLRDSSDWMLSWQIFLALEVKLGPFTIDLFASRLNAQLPVYCSWRPNPAALAVDALSISWRDQHPYLFPPFAPIGKYLQKILQEEVEALLIAPVWQTQIWYPTLLGMLVERPVLLPNTQNILQGP